MDKHILSLVKICFVKECNRHPEEKAVICMFHKHDAIITVRLVFNNDTGKEGLVITDITTMPEPERGKGYGSIVLHTILTWARESKFAHIRAMQVSNKSEYFWSQNGFQRTNNETNDFRFTLED